MKKGLLPEGFSLRKVSEADLQIANYITDNSSLQKEVRIRWASPHSQQTADSFIVIDPEGNAVGYAEIYENN